MRKKIGLVGKGLFIFFMLQLAAQGCAYAARADSALQYFTDSYDYCYQGVVAGTEENWNETCIFRSVNLLPAPLLSVVWPLEYQVKTNPESQPEDVNQTKLYWGTFVEVRQVLPFGKQAIIFNRLERVWVDGVCVFVNSDGKPTSISAQCTHTDEWTPGTAGFDGRTLTLSKVRDLIQQNESHIQHLGVEYDYLGNLSLKLTNNAK